MMLKILSLKLRVMLFLIILLYYYTGCNKKELSYNYKFDYCKDCLTRQDVINYEMSQHSITIPALSDFEDIRIFSKAYNASSGLDTTHKWTKYNLYYLSFDSTLQTLIAKRYFFDNGYLIGKVPDDSILLWGMNIKYFYKDDYLNKFLHSENDTTFNYQKLKLFAQSIRHKMDSINNIMTEKYVPRNIEKSADFPFKDEMYGYIWADPNKYGIRLELNYHLSYAIAHDGESLKIKEKDMAVYFELDYSGHYLDSLKSKYNFPE